MKDMFVTLFDSACNLAASLSSLCRERILHLLPSLLALFQQAFVFQSLSKSDQLRLGIHQSLLKLLHALGANAAVFFEDLLTEIIEQDLALVMGLQPEKETKTRKKEPPKIRLDFQDAEKFQLTTAALDLTACLYQGSAVVFDRKHHKRLE